MIKVTVQQIIESQEAMRNLLDKQLKGRTAFQVARLIKKLENEISSYNDTRVKLIERYAMKNDDGSFVINDKNEYQFTQENMNGFVQEMNKILAENIEIDVNPIKLEELDNINFTVMEMTMLEPFIEE